MSFNPNDVSFLACVGKNVFKCFRFQSQEGDANKGYSLKCLSNSLVNPAQDLSQHYTCHSWMINVDHFVCASSLGELFICDEAGEF